MQKPFQLGLEDILFRNLQKMCLEYSVSGNKALLANSSDLSREAIIFTGRYSRAKFYNVSVMAFEDYVSGMLDDLGKKFMEVDDSMLRGNITSFTPRELLSRGRKAAQTRLQNRGEEYSDSILRVGEFLAVVSGDDAYAFAFLSKILEKYHCAPFVPESEIMSAIAAQAYRTGGQIVSRRPQEAYLSGVFAHP